MLAATMSSFLSSSKSTIFCSIDLKMFSFLKQIMLLMYVKFRVDINKNLEIIYTFVMFVFLCHPV